MPPGLVKRAAGLAAAKRARLVKESRSLIALVKRRIDEVADRFYDMGVALRRLREREMLDALGMTFDVLCKTHLGLSTSLAEKLVHVASTMTREQAIAMAAVAAATPEDDGPAKLFEAGELRTPRGKKIDPRKASVRDIERVAKEIRQAHAPRGARARTHHDRRRTRLRHPPREGPAGAGPRTRLRHGGRAQARPAVGSPHRAPPDRRRQARHQAGWRAAPLSHAVIHVYGRAHSRLCSDRPVTPPFVEQLLDDFGSPQPPSAVPGHLESVRATFSRA